MYKNATLKLITQIKIIKSIIEKDERLSSIRLNTKTNKIDIGNRKISIIDYDEILDKCKEEWPDTKFTLKAIKDVVAAFAIKNKYKPEDKHDNLCPWYDKYEVNEKGKILKTLYNVLVLFENDPRFKGKFSIDESYGVETYNNKWISDYDIAKFMLICEKEIGFCNRSKIDHVIRLLANKELYDLISGKV